LGLTGTAKKANIPALLQGRFYPKRTNQEHPMFAVFKTGGKQYRASKGDVITVEKIEAEKGATVEIDDVLMVGEGEDFKVGTPFLDGGKVSATVLDHGRHDKIKVVKFKRRKHHRKQMGHRQYFTQLEITGIDA
jgi:large subunit ribosomal protein L21